MNFFDVYSKIKSFFKDRSAYDLFIDVIIILYLLFIFSFSIFSWISNNVLLISYDHLLFIGLIFARFKGVTNKFVTDFLPFALLFFAYHSMEGFIDDFSPFNVNYSFLIDADILLGGGNLPIAILQDFVLNIGLSDIALSLSVIIYCLHFTVPFLFIIYLKSFDIFSNNLLP